MDFVQFGLDTGALKYGQFTLKSGRSSPYFFDAGQLTRSGETLLKTAKFYADKARDIECDVLFGAAYKGIPIASATGLVLAGQNIDRGITFDRKEVKTHGETGWLVGASLEGKKVLLLDDVLTAGTAARLSAERIKAAAGILVGVLIALDRMEKSNPEQSDSLWASQQLSKDLGVPVYSIASAKDLVLHLEQTGQDASILKQHLMAHSVTF